MSNPTEEQATETTAELRPVPVDWEALENAFENNAPEVHSYLQLATGDVLRIVDGVADPAMHSRIAADARYLRVEAVSSREQYRWMECYIPTVEEDELRARLEVAIDGKGAFRRFKDVLMTHSTERERWFTYRSERLRTFMEAWLAAHTIKSVERVVWTPPATGEPGKEDAARRPEEARRTRNLDVLRQRMKDITESLGPRDLDTVLAFAEFLKARRSARAFSNHYVPQRNSETGLVDASPAAAPETSPDSEVSSSLG